VKNWGFVEGEKEYRLILASADLVVSTALHDFQGLAVLEAVAAGCLPVVPDRLAYRELLPESFRYSSREEDPEGEMEILAQRLEDLCQNQEMTRKIKPPDLRFLAWENMDEKYREIINSMSRV